VATLVSSARRWLVLLAISAGSMMAGLDSSITNTVLPVVATSLRASVSTTQWVVLVYLLLATVLALITGRLGDFYGHRRLYLLGYVVFVASSATCGFAPAIGWLIAARACQALGAAMLVSNAPAILTSAFPDRMRGRVLGLQVTAVYLGLLIGPSIGGFLTAHFSWSAVFLVNVPVGLLAFVLSVVFLQRDSPQSAAARRFDTPGAVTLGVGLILLILGLNQASIWGWTSPALIGCFAVAGGSLVAFVWIEPRRESPLLDFHLFQNRHFATAVAGLTLNYAGGFASTFVLPFYLIQGRGMSPAEAGLVLTAVPLLMPVLSPVSGALSDRVGTRLPTTAGVVLSATALFWLSRLQVGTPLHVVIGSLVLLGIGAGLFTSPMSSAILGSAPRERRGVASGTLSTARGLGMVLGFSLGGTVFTAVVGGSGVGASTEMVIRAADATLLVATGLTSLAATVLILRMPTSASTAFRGGSVRHLARLASSMSIRRA
jgi:EmrB/QacA subfamily drug resistance transporter